MNAKREELEKQIREAQEKIDAIDAYEAGVGQENWAVTEYHGMVCTWSHVDGCLWTYESDEDFSRPGTTHIQYLRQYRKIKNNYEKETGVKVSHESFVRILAIILKKRNTFSARL